MSIGNEAFPIVMLHFYGNAAEDMLRRYLLSI
jgi:hypothetical protein